MGEPNNNETVNQTETAVVETTSSVVTDIRSQISRPGTRYKVPLSELVSRVVASNQSEYRNLIAAVQDNFEIATQLSGAPRASDWEKALYDEANFQFSSTHRPLVEAVLNGGDSELRKEVRTKSPSDRTVDIRLRQNGFSVRDSGEGMSLDTVLTRLLVPKLTGNLVEESDVIGRFGVGFYSLLGYLSEKEDGITINTYDGQEGYRVSISRYYGPEKRQQGNFAVTISPLSENKTRSIGVGTEIEVRCKKFDEPGARGYLSRTLAYKTDIAFVVNGGRINDIDNFEETNVDLPEKYGSKQRKIRILESKVKSKRSRIFATVGGVTVEEFEVEGDDLPSTFVIELPPGTALPKSRDKIEVNSVTIEAASTLIENVLARDPLEAVRLVTLVTPVISRLQSRNPFLQQDKNMERQLRFGVASLAERLPKGNFLMPYFPEMEKVNLPGAIPIEASYLDGKFNIPGREPHKKFISSFKLFSVPFKNSEDVIAVGPGMIFVNENIGIDAPEVTGMLNALMNILDKTKDHVYGFENGYFVSEGVVDLKPIELAKKEPTEEREPEKPVSETEDRMLELENYLRSLSPKIVGRPIYADKQITVLREVPQTDEELENDISDRTFRLREKGLRGLIQKLLPWERRQFEEQRQDLISRIPRTKLATVKETVQEEIGRDYTPETVEQLRRWWIDDVLEFALRSYSFEDSAARLKALGSKRNFFISADPNFWRDVLDHNFYSNVHRYLIADPLTRVKAVIADLPDQVRESLMEAHNWKGNNIVIRPGLQKYISGDMLETLGSIWESGGVAPNEQKIFAQVVLSLSASEHMGKLSSIFSDEALLATFVKGGEFSGFFNQVLQGQFHGYPDRFDPLNNFVGTNTSSCLANHELQPICFMSSTQQKIEYIRWFLRNAENCDVLRADMYKVIVVTKENQIRKGSATFSQMIDGELIQVTSHKAPDDVEIHIAPLHLYENLFSSGIDSDEAWENLHHNIKVMHDLSTNQIIRERYFRDFLGKYSIPEILYLASGRIREENLQAIMENASNDYLSDLHREEYFAKALGYSFLSPDVFSKINMLLYRMASEKTPDVESAAEKARQNSLFASEYFDLRKDALTDDGWRTRSTKRSEGGLSRSFPIDDQEKGAEYRLFADSEEMIQQRCSLLENLPVEYARLYFCLQKMLVDPQTGVVYRGYRDTNLQVEKKLLAMFAKLTELPRHEANRVMVGLMKESSKGRSGLVQSLEDFSKIDRVARPWLLYLLNDSEGIPTVPKALFMDGVEKKHVLFGSDLVGHYLASEDLSRVDSLDDLIQLTRPKIEDRAGQVGQRRIEHAANYQSPEGYLWLRELIQNAFNVTREKPGSEVAINNFIEGGDFAIQVTDPVGMDINTVINALLIPQNSKWESDKVIGYFGQGFFTVFKEAKEVRVKTSVGGGKTYYINIFPQRDFKTGKIYDLSLQIGEAEEAFKGTSVTWFKDTPFQEFEASRAKAETATYAGFIPTKELKITWNGELINQDLKELSVASSSLGDVKVYSAAGVNTVIQNGLYVKELDLDYVSKIPSMIRGILFGQGIVLEIPSGIRLIDSRADIAKKEEVLPFLYSAISEAAVKAAVGLFIEGRVNLDRLPYDFFINAEQYSAAVDDEIKSDVISLQTRENSINWSKYFEDERKALQLIISINSIDFNGKKISLCEAIKIGKADPSQIEKMPPRIIDFFVNQGGRFEMSLGISESEFEKRGYTRTGDFSVNNAPKEYDVYEAWQELYKQLLATSIAQTGRDFAGAFYCKPDAVIARCLGGRLISWNLAQMEIVEILSRLIKEEPTPAELQLLFEKIADTGSHEYVHVVENSKDGLTHDPSFFRQQKQILERMISTADIAQIKEALRKKYSGGYISPPQLSVLKASAFPAS